jgi:hypothetical protein
MNILQRWKQTALHNKALVLTGAIVAFGTLAQLCIVLANDRTTAKQIDKLIQAAKIQGDAANENASAAQSFARSADGMNTRLTAVEQDFQRTAKDSEKSIRATQVEAARALTASIESSEADQRAWFGVSNFEVSQYDPSDPQKPFRVYLGLRNSGKTPALQIRVTGMFQVYDSKVDGPTDGDWSALQGFFNQEKGRYIAAPNATRALISSDASNNLVTKNYAEIKLTLHLSITSGR